VIYSYSGQNFSKLLSLITIRNFHVSSSGGKLIKNMARNYFSEGKKVICTLFTVNLITEDDYVYACVCLSIRGSRNQSRNRRRNLKFWSSFGLSVTCALEINQNQSTGTGPGCGFLSHRMMGLTLLV